jgi:enoyl-CoA hydratase
LALAESIAARASQAVRAAKRAIDEGLALSLPAGQALEAALADTTFQTADAAEGVAAFIEKRPPQFTHR